MCGLVMICAHSSEHRRAQILNIKHRFIIQPLSLSLQLSVNVFTSHFHSGAKNEALKLKISFYYYFIHTDRFISDTYSLTQCANRPIVWQQCIKSYRYRQQLQVLLTSPSRMGKNAISVILTVVWLLLRWAGLSVSITADLLGFSHTASLEWTNKEKTYN